MIPLLEPMLEDFKPGTVGWVLQKDIDDMESIGKHIGKSERYSRGKLQRDPINTKMAAKLKRSDIIDLVKRLRGSPGRNGTPICPSTANKYVGSLAVAMKRVGASSDDWQDITVAPVEAARPYLEQTGLIGKGQPRTRVPSPEELETILAAAEARDNSTRWPATIKLLPMILFALESTRRLGEICRLRWDDIDWDRKDAENNPTPMYLIRDVKHSRRKKGNHKEFPLTPLLGEIILTQGPRLTNHPEERVFPYNEKSASQAFARLTKRCAIDDLRFHDNRREAITRWLAKLRSPHKVRFISGHDNTLVLERVYDATKPVSLHNDIRYALSHVIGYRNDNVYPQALVAASAIANGVPPQERAEEKTPA